MAVGQTVRAWFRASRPVIAKEKNVPPGPFGPGEVRESVPGHYSNVSTVLTFLLLESVLRRASGVAGSSFASIRITAGRSDCSRGTYSSSWVTSFIYLGESRWVTGVGCLDRPGRVTFTVCLDNVQWVTNGLCLASARWVALTFCPFDRCG